MCYQLNGHRLNPFSRTSDDAEFLVDEGLMAPYAPLRHLKVVLLSRLLEYANNCSLGQYDVRIECIVHGMPLSR